MMDDEELESISKPKKRGGGMFWDVQKILFVIIFVLGIVIGVAVFPYLEPVLYPEQATLKQDLKDQKIINSGLNEQIDCIIQLMNEGKGKESLSECI